MKFQFMIEHLETHAIRGTKDTRLFVPKAQPQTDGKKPSKGSGRRGEKLEKEAELFAYTSSVESARTRHVVFESFPCISITSNQDAGMSTHADSDTSRLLIDSPPRSRRKVV